MAHRIVWSRRAAQDLDSITDYTALFTESQTAQLVAQSLRLFGIARGAKTFGKVEECLLFLFPCFDAQLNEFHQDTVIAQTLALCHTIYLFGNWSRE
jgi:hypothetical protein